VKAKLKPHKMKKLLSTTILLFSFYYLGFAQEVRVYKEPKFGFDWSKPSEYPDRIILNFGQDPATHVNVTWRTHTDIKVAFAEVAVALGAPKFWRAAKTYTAKTETLDASKVETAEVIANYHSAEFTELMPNTMYAYRVGDGERWSEWFQFRTASSNPNDKFSFLYVGDAQNYILELWSRLIREGFRKAPEASFIIHAGDLINAAHREQEWHEWFTAGGFIHSMIPSVPTPGNHEYRALAAGQPRSLSVQWNPQFTLPQNGPEGLKETVYYMDYQDMRLISLNSNVEVERQIPWLEEVLKSNTKKWTVVTYHHPLFSASAGRDNKELRELWKPIFDKYNVDLALQGHDHSYARGRSAPGANVMDGVNLRDKTGTVYVVSVSGGKMYSIDQEGWEKWGAERDRAAENTQLFQVITIEGNLLKFESYTAVGELYDAFDLLKTDSGHNQFIERKSKAGDEYLFSNTMSYEDILPTEIEEKLLKLYPGFQVTRVNFAEKDKKVIINVRLENGAEQLNLILDNNGNLIEKVK
jgi:hypothetical protein